MERPLLLSAAPRRETAKGPDKRTLSAAISSHCLPDDSIFPGAFPDRQFYLLSRVHRRRRLANFGVPRLDHRVDEIAALAIRQKRALHCIDGDLFEIINRQTKCIRRGLELLRHAGAAHQPIIGIEGDAKFFLIKNLKRMLSKAGRRASMDITDEANLQRDSLIEHVLRQIT